MSEGILGNATGGFGFPKTYIITDSDGNELTGVYVESETIFTATDNDVREGFVYAGDGGVSTGSKNIPAYHTMKASKLILPNMSYSITLADYDLYDYTKFQCVIAIRNTSISDSVAVNRVAIEDSVYEVNSSEVLSTITKNSDTKSIDFNITNDTEDIYVIHYFTYKEEE